MQNKTIYFEEKAMEKMRCYIDICPGEVAGLGRVVKEPLPGTFTPVLIVKDIKIFEQEVTGASADLDPQSIAKFLDEIMQTEPDTLSQWRVWWHSHGTMSAFFSGTDTGTIESSTEFEWLISVVGNKEGDIKARFDMYEPLRGTISELQIKVLREHADDVMEECRREVEAKVKEPVSRYNGAGFHPRTVEVDGEDDDEEMAEQLNFESPLPGETDEEFYERIGYDPARGQLNKKGRRSLRGVMKW